MADAIDFQPYLKALPDPANHDWGDRYTPTQAELPLKVRAIVQDNPGDPTAQRSLEAQKRERFEVLEGLRKAVRKHHQGLLIGKPGSGKSTALRRLLWEDAQTALKIANSGQGNFTVPVLVELRDCRSGSVLEWIQKALRRLRLSQETVEDLLFAGRLLLLFDGLNEVPTSDAYSALDEFRRDEDFHTVPIIVTTRELGAGADLGIEKKLEMVPLTEPQMREFIQKRLPGQADELLRQLKDRLRELAETPLLLQMLCDVVAESPDGQIPQNRGELFRQEFARRYETFKPLKGRVSDDSRRFALELLQHLAFVMTQGDPHTTPLKPTPAWLTIPKVQAETILEAYLTNRVEAPAQAAKEWLEDLLEFHLLQIASNPDEIEFHHQLFQEYYAAEALLQKLPKLSDTELKQNYLNYLKWTEAIALMSSLLENEVQALQVTKLALEVDWMLGARLAGEVQPKWQEQTVERISTLDIPPKYKMQLLGNTHSDHAVPYLIESLIDEQNAIWVFEAAFALRELNRKSAIPELLKTLDHHNSVVVVAALFALGAVGDSTVIPSLKRALNHSNDSIQSQAAESLGELYIHSAVPDLLNALKDKTRVEKVHIQVVKALVALASDSAIPDLLKIALEDSSDFLRWVTAEALAQIDYDKAARELLKALNSENHNIRDNAAEALGKVGNEIAVEELVVALREHSWQAAIALKEIGSTKATPLLITALQNPCAAELAAWTLGELGDSMAVPSLINVLDHWHSQLVENAVEALGQLGDEAAIPALSELLQTNPANSVRLNALIALGKLGEKQVLPELINLLKQQALGRASRRSDWWEIFAALEKISGQLVVSALIQVLKSPMPNFRWKSAEALGNLADPSVIDSLLDALTDEHSTVRMMVAQALGKFDCQSILPKLISFLEPDNPNIQDPNVREAAIRAFGDLADKKSVEVLIQTLTDPELVVRYSAAEALAKLSNLEKMQHHVAEVLSPAWKSSFVNDGFVYPLRDIKNNCKFYNYKIAWSAVEEGSGVLGVGGEDKKGTTYAIKAEVVQIIEQNHGNVIGQ
ncbi:MAG: HEAT repeat domain-containing protein [Stenomitos rutilans HA7619-LM2]|jgi:HEAT repeat protein|nr:HEAT repeat domain-containing protein [Stenomitos rutilans HA7619-LM2]